MFGFLKTQCQRQLSASLLKFAEIARQRKKGNAHFRRVTWYFANCINSLFFSLSLSLPRNDSQLLSMSHGISFDLKSIWSLVVIITAWIPSKCQVQPNWLLAYWYSKLFICWWRLTMVLKPLINLPFLAFKIRAHVGARHYESTWNSGHIYPNHLKFNQTLVRRSNGTERKRFHGGRNLAPLIDCNQLFLLFFKQCTVRNKSF